MSERKQHITLKLDFHTVAIDIDPDYEEVYRKAAVWVNERYQEYLKFYRNTSPEKLWAYVALAAAVGLHADVREKSLEPVKAQVNELNNRILEVLDKDTVSKNEP